MEINKELYHQLQSCQTENTAVENLKEQEKSMLCQRAIIVGPQGDDDFLLEHQYLTDKYSLSKQSLGLTIAPTLGCNFACPYCFEEHKRKINMNEETEDAVIAFIKLHSEAQKLNLTWYGGEPLLCVPIIERLLTKITGQCAIPLHRHMLITNGFLLNEKAIGLFKKFPLTSLQITLDGNRERHDSLRKARQSEPSFDRILNNTDRFIKACPETQIHIRINIEKSNVEDFYQLAPELKKRWPQSNVIVYPGFLRYDNAERTDYDARSFTRSEISQVLFQIQARKLTDVPVYPQTYCEKNCSANRKNSYIIGPTGEIYKCWNDVGDAAKVVGNIHENKITNKSLLYRYLVGSKWYHDPQCRSCFFLPICHGGCAWYALRNRYEGGHYDLCTCLQKSPGLLEKCLEAYYEALTAPDRGTASAAENENMTDKCKRFC